MNEEKHWGQQLLKLLDSRDMSGWDALAINDPVEWVKAVRQRDLSRLDAYWNGTEEDDKVCSLPRFRNASELCSRDADTLRH